MNLKKKKKSQQVLNSDKHQSNTLRVFFLKKLLFSILWHPSPHEPNEFLFILQGRTQVYPLLCLLLSSRKQSGSICSNTALASMDSLITQHPSVCICLHSHIVRLFRAVVALLFMFLCPIPTLNAWLVAQYQDKSKY